MSHSCWEESCLQSSLPSLEYKLIFSNKNVNGSDFLDIALVQNLLGIFNSFNSGHDKWNEVNENYLAIFSFPIFFFYITCIPAHLGELEMAAVGKLVLFIKTLGCPLVLPSYLHLHTHQKHFFLHSGN